MAANIDIFQIWINDPGVLTNKELKWMRTVINKRPKNYNYNLIATSNFLSEENITSFENVNSIIAQAIALTPNLNEIWGRLTVHQQSQILRTYIASKSYDMAYFDCDVEVVNWINRLQFSDKPYFLKRSDTKIDNHVFFSNKKKEWFGTFLTEIVSSMKATLDRGDRIRYGHSYALLNSKTDEVYELESQFSVHHNRG